VLGTKGCEEVHDTKGQKKVFLTPRDHDCQLRSGVLLKDFPKSGMSRSTIRGAGSLNHFVRSSVERRGVGVRVDCI